MLIYISLCSLSNLFCYSPAISIFYSVLIYLFFFSIILGFHFHVYRSLLITFCISFQTNFIFFLYFMIPSVFVSSAASWTLSFNISRTCTFTFTKTLHHQIARSTVPSFFSLQPVPPLSCPLLLFYTLFLLFLVFYILLFLS